MAHTPTEALCDLMPGLELRSGKTTPKGISAEQPSDATLPSSRQFFTLMKLPTEVRFMIYAIAMQQTIDHATSPPFGTPRLMPVPVCKQKWSHDPKKIPHKFLPKTGIKNPPLVGALALLCANRELRSESAHEFIRLAPAHVKALRDRTECLNEDLIDLKSGKAQLLMPRFSRLPLFKSVKER